MTNSPHTSIIPLSDDELKTISIAAAEENPNIHLFNIGYTLAEFCSRKIRKCTAQDIKRMTTCAPDTPEPIDATPAAIQPPAPVPAAPEGSEAAPAPYFMDLQPSDEDPFAEFHHNNQPTAHHA